MHFVPSHPCAVQILHQTSIGHLYQHCTNSAQKYLANTTSAISSVDVDVDVDHQCSGWNLTHSRLRPCWRRTPWPSGLGVGSNIGASIPLPSSHQHHHHHHHQYHHQCYKYLDTGFSQTLEYSLLCTLSRTYKQKSASVR